MAVLAWGAVNPRVLDLGVPEVHVLTHMPQASYVNQRARSRAARTPPSARCPTPPLRVRVRVRVRVRARARARARVRVSVRVKVRVRVSASRKPQATRSVHEGPAHLDGQRR